MPESIVYESSGASGCADIQAMAVIGPRTCYSPLRASFSIRRDVARNSRQRNNRGVTVQGLPPFSNFHYSHCSREFAIWLLLLRSFLCSSSVYPQYAYAVRCFVRFDVFKHAFLPSSAREQILHPCVAFSLRS